MVVEEDLVELCALLEQEKAQLQALAEGNESNNSNSQLKAEIEAEILTKQSIVMELKDKLIRLKAEVTDGAGVDAAS